jgi:hypothetical protein
VACKSGLVVLLGNRLEFERAAFRQKEVVIDLLLEKISFTGNNRRYTRGSCVGLFSLLKETAGVAGLLVRPPVAGLPVLLLPNTLSFQQRATLPRLGAI